jgi:hypothetical protein
LPQPPQVTGLAVQPLSVLHCLHSLAHSASQTLVQHQESMAQTHVSQAQPPHPFVVTALQPLCGVEVCEQVPPPQV